MEYEIAEFVEQMPKELAGKLSTDRYADHKRLLEKIPAGQIARIPLPKPQYRSFSAGVRAAGLQLNKKVGVAFHNDSAYVSWAPLTEANRPKRTGPRPKTSA